MHMNQGAQHHLFQLTWWHMYVMDHVILNLNFLRWFTNQVNVYCVLLVIYLAFRVSKISIEKIIQHWTSANWLPVIK